MKIIDKINEEYKPYIDIKKKNYYPNFFKTKTGEYGEGDIFIGVSVPNQRKVAKKNLEISFAQLQSLLQSPYHEHRLTALFILVYKYKKNTDKKEIYDFYLKNINFINNWDLVDSSCDKIMGPYLFEKDKTILYELSKSNNLWERRIAIITTFYFIKNNKFTDTIQLSKILLNDSHDLIHKAVGWMLREVGNRNLEEELSFLNKHYKQMPRTMLRYAIEKFPEELRKAYLKGQI
ncbi:MAG: DNA alkylation repair protein [Eubacteriaceae bacterium]